MQQRAKSFPVSQEFLSRAETRGKFALKTGLFFSILLAIVFILYPEIDLKVTNFFYHPQTGENRSGFTYANSEALKFYFWMVDAISRVVLLTAIGLTTYYGLKRHQKLLASAIVTTSLLLGPVITVNGVLKDHWDRARPRQVVEFGGTQKFTPAWVISNQCVRNCSFVSGHAAAGFSFIVAHFVAAARLWFWMGIVLGGITGLTRIMVGAHFFSDVVFAFFIVYMIAAAVALVAVKISKFRNRRID